MGTKLNEKQIEKLSAEFRQTVSNWLPRQTSKLGKVAGLSRSGERYTPEEGIVARALYFGKPEKVGVKWTVGKKSFITTKTGVNVMVDGKKYALDGAQKDKLASALLERPITSYQVFCSGRDSGKRDKIAPAPQGLLDYIAHTIESMQQGKLQEYAALKSAGKFDAPKPEPKPRKAKKVAKK